MGLDSTNPTDKGLTRQSDRIDLEHPGQCGAQIVVSHFFGISIKRGGGDLSHFTSFASTSVILSKICK